MKTISLSRLAVHYYRPDFTPQIAKSIIHDLLEDLAPYSVDQVDAAIKVYRQTGHERFFPRSGQLIEIMDRPAPLTPEQIEANMDRADRLMRRGKYAGT